MVSVLLSCAGSHTRDKTTIEFWGLGREGEVVASLVPEFERTHPTIHVDVQQIPWTAAHEKFLTAHVGGSLPDIVQMGNTWIPEFNTVGALEDLGPFVAASKEIRRENYFDGIWQTNIVGQKLYGVPWYVDTRVLFYRSDLYGHPPRTWSEWIAMMTALKKRIGRKDFYPILLPTNEWPQPVIFALEKNAALVTEDGRAMFHEPQFLSAFEFYVDIFRRGLAPVVPSSLIANLFQQFKEGEFAMFISGPWQVGEMRRRLPADFQSHWATAPMPAPDGTPYPGLSLAGGSSLSLTRRSTHKSEAWQFIEFLSQPAQQLKLYESSGDIPAIKSAWQAPVLAGDDKLRAFRIQLDRTVPTPQIPEWEHITVVIFEEGELAARGQFDARRGAARIEARVNAMLAKRRWVMAQR
jgi:multiple sugar transport system substrate-binding protein